MSSYCLRVLRIFDFEPACAVVLVDAASTLRNNAFQISPANLIEESHALSLDVLGVNDLLESAPLDEFVKTLLPLNERQRPQILTIKPQQIEGVEEGLTPAREQHIELTDAVRIEAHDLAIENCIPDRELVERLLQRVERFELIAVAGDQLALVAFDVSQCSEPVVLEFEDVVRVVERLRNAGQAHGLDAGEHILIL